MGYSQLVRGHVDSIARGINVPNAQPDQTGLASVNPIFTWVRLAQRVPVRIHIDRDAGRRSPGERDDGHRADRFRTGKIGGAYTLSGPRPASGGGRGQRPNRSNAGKVMWRTELRPIGVSGDLLSSIPFFLRRLQPSSRWRRDRDRRSIRILSIDFSRRSAGDHGNKIVPDHVE